ncbi:MAG: hypothetical protein QOJ00_1946 [Actinomycetota bacterium]
MTLLIADQVWDGTAHAAIDSGFVEFDGATVIATGSVADLGSRADDATSLPRGTTLMPGLIDAHQHLVFDGVGTLEEQVAGIDDNGLTDRCRANAELALRAGITTIRDLGDRGFVTVGLSEHGHSLPTILPAGPPLTRVGGHCWYLGGECDGVDALRRAVRDRVERGCKVVKVMTTGGGMTPTFPMWQAQFSDAEVRAIVDEAHSAGLPVAAHCHGLAGIVQALDAGADTIEHCTFITESGRCEPQDDVMQRIAASDVVVSATVGHLPGFDPPPFVTANLEIMFGTFRTMRELGATIVGGTDAGVGPAKPHNVLPTAMEDFAEIGMNNVEALRALTSVAAKTVGVGDRKGRLAPGYDADVIAVNGDPTTDANALGNVTQVWRAGRACL